MSMGVWKKGKELGWVSEKLEGGGGDPLGGVMLGGGMIVEGILRVCVWMMVEVW